MKRKRAGKTKRDKKNGPGSSSVRLIGGQYEIASRWPIFVMAGLTLILSLPLFAPLSVWLFGYVVFVPWLAVVGIARRSGWVYTVSFLLGFAFFLVHFRWLYSTTGPGYVAAAIYLAFFFLLATWPIRHLYRRRGLGMTIVFPLVWTTIELLRSLGPLGFPWFYLGHSQIRLLPMIQVADLAGVYGVTFVVAMVNGWLMDLLLGPIMFWPTVKTSIRSRRATVRTAIVVAVVGATVIYGRFRLSTGQSIEGPKISVLQGDFVLSPIYDPNAPTERDKQRTYFGLIDEAAKDSPDMIVLPETPWGLYLNRELRELPISPMWSKVGTKRRPRLIFLARSAEQQHERFVALAEEHGTPIVVGSLTEETRADDVYPKEYRYNSAYVYTPGEQEPDRYDKIHLVVFGEYVPFRYWKGLHWLYRFLNDGPWNPWGSGGYEYSLEVGKEFTTFPLQARSLGNATFNFGITICYEDVMPQIFRRFVVGDDGSKRVDFMLNISNDGWFGHGSQQAQHLVNCAFRAVENRVGIARAVNTGVSGFIAPDGSWHDLVIEPSRGLHAGGTGHSTATVIFDKRLTFYSQYGDLFAWICGLLVFVSLLDAVLLRLRERRGARSGDAQEVKK